MTAYVCGFITNPSGDLVALLTKARPAWQKGRLNGVGGKVEPLERPVQAMVRECREETGYETTPGDWEHAVTLRHTGWVVYFYLHKCVNLHRVHGLDPTEPLNWYRVKDLPKETVPNLRWLIPLALDRDVRRPVDVTDTSDPETDGATVRSSPAALAGVEVKDDHEV